MVELEDSPKKKNRFGVHIKTGLLSFKEGLHDVAVASPPHHYIRSHKLTTGGSEDAS